MTSARDFLEQRVEWLRVATIDRPRGGWDVVLVIDGTYAESCCSREAMIDHFTALLADVLAAEGLDARAEGLGLPWPKFRPTRWVTR